MASRTRLPSKVSGEIVEVSGEIVEISGQHVFVESGVHVIAESGLGVVPQSGQGVVIQSGAGVLISGQHVYVESGANVIVQSGLGVLISGQHVFVESGTGVQIQSGAGVQIQSGVGVLISGQHVYVESGVGVVIQSGIGVLVSGTYISPELRTSGHITALFDLSDLAGEQPTFVERWEWLANYRDRQQVFYRKYCGRGYPYSPIWKSEASGLISESWTVPPVIVNTSGVSPVPWDQAIMLTNSKDGVNADDIYIASRRTFKPPCVMRIVARIPDVNGAANGACGSGTLYAFGWETNSHGGQSVAAVEIYQSNMLLYMASLAPPGLTSGAIYNRNGISASNAAIWNLDGGAGWNPLNNVVLNNVPLYNPDRFANYYLHFDPPFLRVWQATSGNLFPFFLSELKMQKEFSFDNMQAFVANESEVLRSGFAIGVWAVWEQNPKGKYTDLLMSGASIGHSGVYLAGSGGSGSAVSVDLDCAQFNKMAITLQTVNMSSMINTQRLYLLGMVDQSGTVVDSENMTDAFAYIEPLFLSGQMTSSVRTVNVDTLPRYLRLLLRNLAVTSAGAYRVYGHFSRGID